MGPSTCFPLAQRLAKQVVLYCTGCLIYDYKQKTNEVDKKIVLQLAPSAFSNENSSELIYLLSTGTQTHHYSELSTFHRYRVRLYSAPRCTPHHPLTSTRYSPVQRPQSRQNYPRAYPPSEGFPKISEHRPKLPGRRRSPLQYRQAVSPCLCNQQWMMLGPQVSRL